MNILIKQVCVTREYVQRAAKFGPLVIFAGLLVGYVQNALEILCNFFEIVLAFSEIKCYN